MKNIKLSRENRKRCVDFLLEPKRKVYYELRDSQSAGLREILMKELPPAIRDAWDNPTIRPLMNSTSSIYLSNGYRGIKSIPSYPFSDEQKVRAIEYFHSTVRPIEDLKKELDALRQKLVIFFDTYKYKDIIAAFPEVKSIIDGTEESTAGNSKDLRKELGL